MDYRGKTVWITGASSGIGEAVAKEFAHEGARLVISSPEIEELERVRKECLEFCQDCLVLPLDLTRQDEFPQLVEKVLSDFGSINLLINNGGISQRSLVSETPIEIDRKVFEINFFGTIALTKAVLPVMLKQGSGQIAAVSSITGKFGFPLRSAYSASKHALFGFFETLYLENAKNGIKVNMIIPGRVQTAISKHAITSNGSAHGKMDDGQSGGITKELAARKIIIGLRKDKKEILVGAKELNMVHIRRFFPALFRRIAMNIKAT
ncbi:MAG: SDR family oxidoreductase [Bacteroidales bacterium]|nr:SDR family oxidoreductase [Bacteroidales bacterium]MCF8456898.1 SDR family oxidoreductase [Bacteroidales bacterium]